MRRSIALLILFLLGILPVKAAQTAHQVDLEWHQDNPQPPGIMLDHTEVDRDGSMIGSRTPAIMIYSDIAVKAGEQHLYNVVNVDVLGIRSISSASVLAMIPADPLPPAPPPGCSTSSAGWKNTSFSAPAGTYTVTFDATPSQAKMDGAIALAPVTVSAYSQGSVMIRFYTNGMIEAMSGSGYSTSTVAYTGGVKYSIRLVINGSSRTFSAYATAAGGTEKTIGTNLLYRTSQTSTAALNKWAMISDAGAMTVCAFTTAAAAPPVTVTISPKPAAPVIIGSTLQFTATVTNSTAGVVWSANAPGGLFTAPAIAGTALVTAMVGTVSDSVTVTIIKPPLTISCADISMVGGLQSGDSYTLTISADSRTASCAGVKQ